MFLKKQADNPSQDDLALVGAYKSSGDLAYLGELYQRYMHLVYGVCLKYLKNPEASQDATMQLFEKLITALKKHEVSNFKSWLHVMAKNHCLMALRKEKGEPVKEFSDWGMENGYEQHHANDDGIELEENLTKLEACIEQLQSEQQSCISLFYLKKKPYKTISAETGLELKKVKSHIQNGKRNLKACMENS